MKPTRCLPTVAAAGLLMLITVVCYLPVLRCGYVWDDDDHITDNWTLRSLSGLQNIWFKPRSIPQYYPLVHTTLWVEYHLWGLNPLGYHLVNVLIHGCNAVLLWSGFARAQWSRPKKVRLGPFMQPTR